MTDTDRTADGSSPANIATKTGGAASARRRRRWTRLLVTAVVLVMLFVVATAGVGYYFAGQLVTVDHSPTYAVKVEALHGNEVTLSRDVNTDRPVLLGLTWPDGAATLSASVRVSDDTVVRTVTSVVRGTLRVGLDVAVDRNVYDTDPKRARGLDYETVSVHGELGEMPAWYVPPTAEHPHTTWVIAVHGRDAIRQESLRILPTIAAAGLPALVITYRNDEGAPASPDGLYHLGDTEWRDIVAAIDYARAHGATGVVLYGWSMGGGMIMMALRRMPPDDSALVRGVVLDSPVLSWNAVIDLQGSQRFLPGFVIWAAKQFTERRTGLSLRDLDLVSYAPDLKVPVLVFVDEAERHVPTGPAHEFARSRPDLVTLVSTTGGGHIASWNVDPASYESAVITLLDRVS
jgi:pimeloyl-ACP methyl ester carboxylesterase